MYCAIYSYDYEGAFRKHLGNVKGVSFTNAERTFDFGGGSVTGICDFEIDRALIACVKNDSGQTLCGGFHFKCR